MTKYVLAYHGVSDMPDTEEAMGELMEAWGAWFGSMGDALLDGGNPIAGARTVKGDGSVSDGGGANPLTGYSLIEADSFDAAVAIAKGCPVLANAESSVEVAEAIDM